MNKLSDDLITISTMLMVAKSRGEIINLANDLNAAVLKAMEIETPTSCNENKRAISTTIKFTKQEIDKMSKTFKKEFIANGCVAHVIKRPSGKNGVYYEIRYRRNGYNITVSNKKLQRAKELFISATNNLEPPETLAKRKLLFGNIADEWLDYKKGKIEDKTWKIYQSYVIRNIPKEMRNIPINSIRTIDIDKFIKIVSTTPRIYEDMRTVFNSIFKYAIASGITNFNPVTLVPFKRADRQRRERLTNQQIITFLNNIKTERFNKIRQVAYVLYFFGLRPCEIDEETRSENGFLIARNRKRKNGKIEYKKIPIPEQAYGFIDFNKPIKPALSYYGWTEMMEKALGNKLTSYNLRHTFASICSEFVQPEIVELWMGDSPERLVDKVYIHYSDEFMKQQMNKVKFILP